MLGFYSRRQPRARIVHLDFNAPDPVQQARRRLQEAACTGHQLCLLIDCRHLPGLRTHGVGHWVSQLLLIHHLGAGVLLHNVAPPLRRLLRLLRLDAVLELTRPALPAAPRRAA